MKHDMICIYLIGYPVFILMGIDYKFKSPLVFLLRGKYNSFASHSPYNIHRLCNLTLKKN